MEQLYDLIERHLDGKTTEAERAEIERRLAADPSFREEINLHRDLRDELGDPDNLRLRAALDSLLLDPPPLDSDSPDVPLPKKPGPNWLKLGSIAGLVVFASFLIWKNWPQPDAPGPMPAIEKASPAAPPVPEKTGPEAPVLPKKPVPIAAADPKAFLPNPLLEDRISDQIRGGNDPETEVRLSSPKIGEVFVLKDGAVALPFLGSVKTDPLPADRPLRLFIYSNRTAAWETRQPLRSLPFPLRPATVEGDFPVHFSQRAELPPGLYYLAIGQARAAADGGGFRFLYFGKMEARASGN